MDSVGANEPEDIAGDEGAATDDTPDTADTDPSSAEDASLRYDRRWASNIEAADGLRWRAILEAAELEQGVDGVVAGCKVDEERDAVIPVRVGFERADDGFSGDVSAEFSLQSFDGTRGTWLELGPATAHLEIGLELASGARCENFLNDGPRILVRWPDMSSGATRLGKEAVTGAIVVKDYRSPNQPDGIADIADRLWAQPSATTAGGSVVGTEGPGVVDVDTVGSNAYELFPLLDGAVHAGAPGEEGAAAAGQDEGAWTESAVVRFLESYTDVDASSDIDASDDLPARTCGDADGYPEGRRLSGGSSRWVAVALFTDAEEASRELSRRIELLENCQGYAAASGTCQPEILAGGERLIYRENCQDGEDDNPPEAPAWVLARSGNALMWTLDVVPGWEQIVEAFESGPDSHRG